MWRQLILVLLSLCLIGMMGCATAKKKGTLEEEPWYAVTQELKEDIARLEGSVEDLSNQTPRLSSGSILKIQGGSQAEGRSMKVFVMTMKQLDGHLKVGERQKEGFLMARNSPLLNTSRLWKASLVLKSFWIGILEKKSPKMKSFNMKCLNPPKSAKIL